MPRVRRPLFALLLLVAVLVVGYVVHAVRDSGSGQPSPSPAGTTTGSLPAPGRGQQPGSPVPDLAVVSWAAGDIRGALAAKTVLAARAR